MAEVIAALGIVGTIVSTISLINDLRKLFHGGVSIEKEMEKLFDEVESTGGITSHLQKQLRKERHRDADKDLIMVLNKLKDNLDKTKEFIQHVYNNPPSAIRFRKLKILKKDAGSKLSVLQMSKRNVIDHVTIACLPSGDQKSPVSDKYLIKKEDLSNIEDLGDGARGRVKKARYKGYQDVFIKYISEIRNQDVIENFRKEARYLVEFWHGYVVRLIGIYDEEDEKFLVLEFMHKKNLDQLLHNCPNEPLEPKRRVLMALDAAKAVLQVNGLVLHTGIEAKRFLVDKDYNVKISDLRFVKTLSSCKRYKSSRIDTVNSKFYMCPEKYSPAPYTAKSEVYRLGIALWEILSRSKPFSTLGEAPSFDDVKKFVEEGKKEELTQDFGNPKWNSDLNILVQKCRNLDPNQRPGVQEIVKKLDEIVDAMDPEVAEDTNRES